LELDEVEVNINQAVPYTLLLNEVVTNAYKHAFKEAEKGEIQLSLKNKDNLISLQVKDDGKGVDRDIDLESPSSLGMTLVKTLSDQLQGTLNIDSGDSGLSVDLTFKRNDQLRGAASSLL
jgi:two-component sensor histidine kinase